MPDGPYRAQRTTVLSGRPEPEIDEGAAPTATRTLVRSPAVRWRN